ncbi:hypothetical protein ACQY0O_008245 [Thecaphora frezii]
MTTSTTPPSPPSPSQPPPPFSEEPVPSTSSLLDPAQELKAAANAHFHAARYDDAIAGYLDAIALLPPRPSPPPTTDQPQDPPAATQNDQADHLSAPPPPSSSEPQAEQTLVSPAVAAATEEAEADKAAPSQQQEDPALRSLRAALHSNLSLCYLKLEQYADAASSATAALASQPDHLKALHRRALANTHIGTWSSLSSALEDQQRILTLPHLPPASRNDVQKAIRDLQPRIEQQAEQEKQEMINKLKGVGNSFLGMFGLSTDNFRLVKGENGGYSMSFVK